MNWCKTGRNCISQGHSWKLTYLLKDLCIFFWGGCCNVNFGMVELAAQTVWLHWMRCQSFRNTFDQMTGSHSNSPGKYDRDYGFPKDSWYSIGDSWRKNASRWNAILPKFVKKAATDLHRFDFDGLRHKHGGSVFLGMEFAAIAVTVWLKRMRCQSFRTSLDQMTGSPCNSPSKYDRDYGSPKKDCESMDPAKVCQIGCYRLASLWFGLGLLGRCKHTGQDATHWLDMVPPSPLINFVIAQGSILYTKSVYKMTRMFILLMQ